MLRTKLARKVLTRKEQRHLSKVAGVHSMDAFLRTRKIQRKQKAESGIEPCFECKHIAKKLEVE